MTADPLIRRSTRGEAVDHRRIHLRERARKRTKRRVLAVIESIELGQTVETHPELRRLDRLLGQAAGLEQRL